MKEAGREMIDKLSFHYLQPYSWRHLQRGST